MARLTLALRPLGTAGDFAFTLDLELPSHREPTVSLPTRVRRDAPDAHTPAAADHLPSVFDSLQIVRGDAGVLGRYLLRAETELADIGVRIVRRTLADLRAVLDVNLASWGGVAPAFDSRQTRYRDADLMVLIAYDRAGQAVGTIAQRRYDLGDQSLAQAIEDLSFLYGGHPDADPTRITFEVTAPAAQLIRGRVVFSGALWAHPSMRGSGLVPHLHMLVRACVQSQWEMDTEVLVGRQKLTREALQDQFRLAGCEPGYKHCIDGQTIYDGYLFWTPRAHIETTLAAALAGDIVPASAAEDPARRAAG